MKQFLSHLFVNEAIFCLMYSQFILTNTCVFTIVVLLYIFYDMSEKCYVEHGILPFLLFFCKQFRLFLLPSDSNRWIIIVCIFLNKFYKFFFLLVLLELLPKNISIRKKYACIMYNAPVRYIHTHYSVSYCAKCITHAR